MLSRVAVRTVSVETHPAGTDFFIRRSFVRARRAMLDMRLDEARCELDQLSAREPPARIMSPRLGQTVAILRALICAAQDDFGAALSIALTLTPTAPHPLLELIIRLGHWKKGELHPCGQLAAPLPCPIRASRHALCQTLAGCLDAMIEFSKLRPVLASRLSEEALHLSRERLGRDSSATLLPATLLAESLYELGRLEEADNLLRFRIPAIRSSGTLECAARAYVLLARISRYGGSRDFALSLLRDARELGERRSWPRLVAISWAECALLFAEDGNIPAAEDCLEKLVALVESSAAAPAAVQKQMRMQLAFVGFRIAIACGRCTEACEGLTQLCEDTSSDSANALWSLQLQLQLAAARAEAGYGFHARGILIEALKTGAGQGLCMTFTDAGRVVRQLIAELAREPAPAQVQDLLPYIRNLLRHFDRSILASGTRRATTEINQGLTKRESGILQLIARGLSNKRIAQRLDITPETVKTHAKNIFFKLAAQTRAQAVAHAEALGVI
jgi:LuxR family maltose regulon positive regulatory protein